MKILIKKGHVVDPANDINGVRDILLEKDKISRIEKSIGIKADRVIDAEGKIVMPGIVDMHVHLREPGREDKETIETGTRAALKGGVTSLLAMPNTNPCIDNTDAMELLRKIIKATAQANVFIAAAITKRRLGEELADIGSLKKMGAAAITDDGNSVDSLALLQEALKKAKQHRICVVCHCEDKVLSASGVVNLGIISTRLGLRGISKASEYTRVERDIRLAEKAKTPLHIAHVSCKESVELIARGKKRGVKVTAETAPHYFSLSQEALLDYDTNMKMNPPLRTKEDVEAIRAGLKDGIIDVIASDHAPHTESEKEIEFERAECGVIGLETELAVSITELIQAKILDWPDLVRKLSLNPARILNINKGDLGIGNTADIIVVSPDKEWLVKKESFLSKSKNSAFLGKTLKGLVEHTILAGKIAYSLSQ